MSAWTPSKVSAFRDAYEAFRDVIRIDSKDKGVCKLEPYLAQRMFLDGIFEGLAEDKHNFTCLKSRQLGISTQAWLLDLFWAGMHPGLKGAIVLHTTEARAFAKLTIERYLKSITDDAPEFGFPVATHHNIHQLVLENGSSLTYLVAGVKKGKGSGGLGRMQGLNFIHATEMSSWVDKEGLVSLQQTLSSQFPNRLYIWESTARGFNIFHDMWEAAKTDPTQVGIFIGWWAKESQQHARGTAMFEKYGTRPLTEEEREKIARVKKLYDFDITSEQLSWYRWVLDPSARDEEDGTEIKAVSRELIQQEQPWTEDEAFIMTGSHFFAAKKLSENVADAKKIKLSGYNYYIGRDFTSIIVEPTKQVHRAHLKVWEDPQPGASYVIAADPAFGQSANANQYVVEVFRVFADCLEQVAEFAIVQLDTRQFAWIIAHLCGAYNNSRLIMEINGPGYAVLQAFREMENWLREGWMRETNQEGGLTNVYWNIRQHVLRRIDDLKQNPSAFHWKTTDQNKVELMEFMKGLYNDGTLNIRSIEALAEMKRIVRDGRKVAGEGESRDDRPVAIALACRAWEDGEKRRLKAMGRTRDAEMNQRNYTQGDLQSIFSQNLFTGFMQDQAKARQRAEFQARRLARGGRSNLSRW